jgi:hypothetical protein
MRDPTGSRKKKALSCIAKDLQRPPTQAQKEVRPEDTEDSDGDNGEDGDDDDNA